MIELEKSQAQFVVAGLIDGNIAGVDVLDCIVDSLLEAVIAEVDE